MPFLLTMPKLSPTMEEGTITRWHKKVGEHVAAGDVLMEVATDKATVEYQAIDEGWLKKILIEEGKEACINQAIAVFTESKEESIENFQIPQPPKKQPPKKQPPKEEPAVAKQEKETVPASPQASMSQPQFTPQAPLESYSFSFPREEAQERILASPLAKKLAREKHLDLTSVKGTGPRGRVTSSDLGLAQPDSLVAFGRRATPQIPPGSYTEEKLSPMRKIIGQRLQESKTFIPHFYLTITVDAAPLVAMHAQLKEGGMKISLNDFLVRACALMLAKHAGVNSGYNSANGTLIRFETVDIAIAVSVDGGLITPIVRHADYKNLGELSYEIKQLAQKARSGKLTPEEYKGGSFTVSNLGMYGVDAFQAIINPPQAAILAVGGVQDTPVVKEGTVVAGKTMKLSLSCDHRVIDGALGALFLKDLKSLLETPALLVI